MTYRGRVQNGVVVLEPKDSLPEGTEVTVQPIVSPPKPSAAAPRGILQFAGKAVGLPSDASRNHDHYLYGTPKR